MAPQGGFYRGSAPARRTRWKRRSVRRDGRRYIFVISVWVFDVGIFHFMFLSFIGWHYLHFLEEMLAAQANKPSNTKGGWTPGILDICPSFNGEPCFLYVFRRRQEKFSQEGTKGGSKLRKKNLKTTTLYLWFCFAGSTWTEHRRDGAEGNSDGMDEFLEIDQSSSLRALGARFPLR